MSYCSLSRAWQSAICVVVLALAAMPPAVASADEGFVPEELIIRLAPAPGAPSAQAVVEAARERRPLPAGLAVGGPSEVRFAIAQRASGEALERLLADPDSPRARLERYIVLTYPPVVDLDAVEKALSQNPNVEVVHRNQRAILSVTPNDPLMTVTGSPLTHQWGLYALSLPAAWDYTKGHAYLGIVDTGIDVDHPDHLGLYHNGSAWVWAGGNYRPHLSHDYGQGDSNVDEGQAQGSQAATRGGHGTHVAGIAAASTGNGTGVAGSCWNCSLMIAKASRLCENLPFCVDGANVDVGEDDVAAAMTGAIDNGAQVINLSLGFRPSQIPDCSTPRMVCDAVDLADRRDVVISAASGNDGSSIADWPATDPRAIGVGGIEFGGAFWSTSNSDPNQLVTPAAEVLSTFYLGLTYAPSIGCDDSLHPLSGYGPCSGTSMSAPHLTGSVGLLRSVNPLLEKEEIRDLLIANVENPPGWNPANGIGKPNVGDAVEDALGRSAGQALDNRLTPLFRLYSPPAEDTFHTTVPQWGAAGYWGPIDAYYVNAGSGVPGYSHFPDTQCRISPCLPPPGADVFILSGDRSPNGHPLVPLYRLSFVGATPSNPDNRDHVYTTEPAGLTAYASVGYRLDGVEGYIYQRCTPEPGCMPPGTVRLYRLYNAALDDHAIFPESLLASYQAQGYVSTPGANSWIGYVYPNTDADFDGLIDGFELLAGTNGSVADSDCDGTSDGDELWEFPYSDPLDGSCGPQVIGEVGQVTNLNHVAQTVSFSRSYSNPVVLAQPASFNGSHVSVVRLTSVTPTGFTFFVDEAPNHDGGHTTETVSWVVLEAGSWQLADGSELEVGKVKTSDSVGTLFAGSFQTVSFAKQFATAPVTLSQVQTAKDPQWVKTRQQLATTTSFRLALEEEEAATAPHGSEEVGWFAITPSTGTWSGHAYQSAVSANVVTDAFTTLSFAAGFSAAPRFVAAMATRNGGNNAGIRYQSLGSGSVQVKVEEDTTWDAEVGHLSERVSFLAIQGNGTLEASPR